MTQLRRQVRRIRRKGTKARVGLPPRRPFVSGLPGRRLWHRSLDAQVRKVIGFLQRNKGEIVKGDKKAIGEIVRREREMLLKSRTGYEGFEGLRDLKSILQKLYFAPKGQSLADQKRRLNSDLVGELVRELGTIQAANTRKLAALEEYMKRHES